MDIWDIFNYNIKNMPLGFHISIADGISNAVLQAEELGCETMQIFTRSPRDWRIKSFNAQDVKEFRSVVKQSAINPVVIHTSYLINLASPDERIYNRSVNLFMHEIKPRKKSALTCSLRIWAAQRVWAISSV
ncbi:MAG: hypothetical protein HZC45_09615 [Deltaproteobacteria bacterium]|nr:hypothetical protein [Deltaproteobacteria bacterium]